MFSKDITVVDLEMQQAIGMIALERSASPFHRLLPCTQRDILYCLHENGCVSVRVNQQQDLPHPQSPIGGVESREVRYVAHGHSEPLRISKSCQVYSGALCPSTEKEVCESSLSQHSHLVAEIIKTEYRGPKILRIAVKRPSEDNISVN